VWDAIDPELPWKVGNGWFLALEQFWRMILISVADPVSGLRKRRILDFQGDTTQAIAN
jgi:hypothetical protein